MARIPTFMLACSSGSRGSLPSARLEQILFFHLAYVEALHGFAEFFARFENDLRIIEMRSRFDDSLRALFRVGGFEDAGANEDGFCPELADECGICGSGDASGGEIRDGKFAGLRDF